MLIILIALLLAPALAIRLPKHAVQQKSKEQPQKSKPGSQRRLQMSWYDTPPQLSPRLCRILYIATSINPALSACANEYTGVFFLRRKQSTVTGPTAVNQLYKSLFYFARLKPRLLAVIGACLRALQTSTVIELVFDPSIGVGAGLNLLALAVASQWPSPLVFGWAVSKPLWRMLRAEKPEKGRHARVPIGIAL